MQRRLIVPVVCLVLGVLMLGATAFFTLRDNSTTTNVAAASGIGGDFSLVDHDGKPIGNADLLGKPSLVFFGFTHCPDVCPTALMEISQVFEALGKDAKVSALFVTVDPERDTPAVMKDYVSNFDPRIVGVTGSRAQIDAAMKSFRVFARKSPSADGGYSMDHSAVVYLMDKKGRFATAFNLQQPARDAAKELARYL